MPARQLRQVGVCILVAIAIHQFMIFQIFSDDWSSSQFCACGDDYDSHSDRCVQTDPGILLWFAGHGGERTAGFISQFSFDPERMLGRHSPSKLFSNAMCEYPANAIESWQNYTYHWLDTRKMNDLYASCKLIDAARRKCLKLISRFPHRRRLSSPHPRLVCSFMRQLLFFRPISKEHEEITLNIDDVRRAFSFRLDPVPTSWADAALQLANALCPAAHMPAKDLFSMNRMATCCKGSWALDSKIETENASRHRKIAAMTVTLNEESTLIFAVGALLPKVDLYLVVDTGSEDRSLAALREIFQSEVLSGKLIIFQMSVEKNLSLARNLALKIARTQNCSHILKVDADDVFYDEGASRLAEMTRAMPNDIQVAWLPQWELVQSTVVETSEWIHAIDSDVKNLTHGRRGQFFRRTDMIFGHDRVYTLTDDLEARGGWIDESLGLPAEGLYYLRRGKFTFLASEVPFMVHYGWARPLKKLHQKTSQWGIPWTGAFPGIGKKNDGNFSRAPFSQHPEIFSRLSTRMTSILSSVN